MSWLGIDRMAVYNELGELIEVLAVRDDGGFSAGGYQDGVYRLLLVREGEPVQTQLHVAG